MSEHSTEAISLAEEYAALHAELDTIKLRTAVLEDRMKQLRMQLRSAVPAGVDTYVMTLPSGTRLRVTPTTRDVYSPATGKSEHFWQWVALNARFDLMQRRISVEGVETYARERGSYPPFIDRHEHIDARVTVTRAPT